MLSPSIENFVEVAESEGVDWEIADVQVPDDSPLVSQQLKDTMLREAGIMLLGVCRSSGEKFFPPPGSLTINAGDNLFAFASSDDLAKLAELLQPTAAQT
jgi:Trk K+ transport system NAD-binding subunit